MIDPTDRPAHASVDLRAVKSNQGAIAALSLATLATASAWPLTLLCIVLLDGYAGPMTTAARPLIASLVRTAFVEIGAAPISIHGDRVAGRVLLEATLGVAA